MLFRSIISLIPFFYEYLRTNLHNDWLFCLVGGMMCSFIIILICVLFVIDFIYDKYIFYLPPIFCISSFIILVILDQVDIIDRITIFKLFICTLFTIIPFYIYITFINKKMTQKQEKEE